MARLTVLDMTQSILSALNSDEVNSISDTVEATQIAKIIKNKYYDIIARSNSPEQKVLLRLDASGDVNKPAIMNIPSGVIKIEWIKYFDVGTGGQTPPGFKYVTILPLDQFLSMTDSLNPHESTTGVFTSIIGGNDFVFYYRKDRLPAYCTVVENHYIIFDSYNSATEVTLQTVNSQAYCLRATPFSLTDNFIPDLDDEKFPLLLNESKALAFYEMKQIQHPLAQQEIKRQWVTSSKNNSVVNKPSHFAQLPDFGRRTRVGSANRWMREK